MRFLRSRTAILAALGFVALVAAGGVVLWRLSGPSTVDLPVTEARVIPLTGDGSRFDYASLDADRGLLFIAHLGAGQVIEVDVRKGTVVRTIDGLADVHGVIVVPALHRVYATATGTDEIVALDEETGREVGRAPTGAYPDGLAYDPVAGTVWSTNEDGGSETVVDAESLAVRGTVPVGDSAGNVEYDAGGRRMLVAVQSDDELAVVDPGTLRVERRVPLPGCDHDHGLRVDAEHRLAFVACDGNARLLTVDLTSWTVTGSEQTGDDPDVLSYDAAAGRLWVAAESGWVTILERDGNTLHVAGRAFLADGAHVVAVDPTDHHAYFPVPDGGDGAPVLLDERPD